MTPAFATDSIVAQVALAFVLLAGSILLGLSLERAMSAPPGFRADHVVSARLHLLARSYSTLPAMEAFTDRLVDAMRACSRVSLPLARSRTFR